MKDIKNILAAPVLIGLCALSSCSKSEESASAGSSAKSYSDVSGKSFKGGEFSPWMSKADQQIAYGSLRKGTYFAYTEGRSEGGLQQYRHVIKSLKKDDSSKYAAYWGLSSNEFYQVDLKLQREGFTRSNLQVFEDGTGAAFHQALWVKKN